jgi:hypothetical protein
MARIGCFWSESVDSVWEVSQEAIAVTQAGHVALTRLVGVRGQA